MKENSETIIKVENVTKRFGGVTAVDDVSLDVYPGEIVGLVGDNGAGKSTLIKMISGVLVPDGGRIYLNKTRIDRKRPKEIRELGIETIYQDLAVINNLTASANVFLGKEVIKNNFLGTLNLKYMDNETEKAMKKFAFELPDLHRPVKFLSGGQRQGVAITRAIHWGKKFLIMDEPTAALGVKESSKVLDIILEIIKHVKAIIMIAHNMEHVIKVATRILVMRTGRLVTNVNCKDYVGRSDDLHNEVVQAITGKTYSRN